MCEEDPRRDLIEEIERVRSANIGRRDKVDEYERRKERLDRVNNLLNLIIEGKDQDVDLSDCGSDHVFRNVQLLRDEEALRSVYSEKIQQLSAEEGAIQRRINSESDFVNNTLWKRLSQAYDEANSTECGFLEKCEELHNGVLEKKMADDLKTKLEGSFSNARKLALDVVEARREIQSLHIREVRLNNVLGNIIDQLRGRISASGGAVFEDNRRKSHFAPRTRVVRTRVLT
jgi:hypothetical protein